MAAQNHQSSMVNAIGSAGGMPAAYAQHGAQQILIRQQPTGPQTIYQQQGQGQQVVYQQQIQERPMNQQPVYQQQVLLQPTNQQPVYQQPMQQQPSHKQFIYQQPVQQQSAYQQPVPQLQLQQQPVIIPATAIQQQVKQQPHQQPVVLQQPINQQPIQQRQQTIQYQPVRQYQQTVQQPRQIVQQQPVQQHQQPILIQQQPIQLQQRSIPLQPVNQQPVQQNPVQQKSAQNQPVQQQQHVQNQSVQHQQMPTLSNPQSQIFKRQSVSSATSVRSTSSVNSSHTSPSQIFNTPPSIPASVSQHMAMSTTTCSACHSDISNDATHLECLACTSAQMSTLFCTKCCINTRSVMDHQHHMSNLISVSDAVVCDPTFSVPGWEVRRSAINITWYHHKASKIKTFERPKPPMPATQAQVPHGDLNSPDGWEEIRDPDGRLFYYHRASKVSRWTRPQDNQLPPDWKECMNPDGRTYYQNTKTQAMTWDRPTLSSPLVTNGDRRSISTSLPQSPNSIQGAILETTDSTPTDSPNMLTLTRAKSQPISNQKDDFNNRRNAVRPANSIAGTASTNLRTVGKKLQNNKQAQKIVAGVGMAAVNAVLIDQLGVKLPNSVGNAVVGLVNVVDFDDKSGSTGGSGVNKTQDTGGIVDAAGIPDQKPVLSVESGQRAPGQTPNVGSATPAKPHSLFSNPSPQQKAALKNAGMKIGASLLRSAVRETLHGNSGGDSYDYGANDSSIDFGDSSGYDVQQEADSSNGGDTGFDSIGNLDDTTTSCDVQGQDQFVNTGQPFGDDSNGQSSVAQDQGQYIGINQQLDGGSNSGNADAQNQDQSLGTVQQFDDGPNTEDNEVETVNDMNEHGESNFDNCDNQPDGVSDGNTYNDSVTDQQATNPTGVDAGIDVTLNVTDNNQSDVYLESERAVLPSIEDSDASVNTGNFSASDTFNSQIESSNNAAASAGMNFSPNFPSDSNTGVCSSNLAGDKSWNYSWADNNSVQPTVATPAYASLTSASLSGPMMDYYDGFTNFGGEVTLDQGQDQNQGQVLEQDQGQSLNPALGIPDGVGGDGASQGTIIVLNSSPNEFASPNQFQGADMQSQSLDQPQPTLFTDINIQQVQIQSPPTALTQLYDGSAYDSPTSDGAASDGAMDDDYTDSWF